jgi:hypothetical protein
MKTSLWGRILGAACLTACAATQSAAASDPLKCERDPACVNHADKAKDCVTQCVDDPACIDRCREVTGQFR